MSKIVNLFFRTLPLPVSLGIVVVGVVLLTLFVASVSFRVFNGTLPPNLTAVTIITAIACALPLALQSIPTIRNLQNSRDRLKVVRDELAARVTDLDVVASTLEETRAGLEIRVERRTRELEAARSNAEQASRAKSAFLAQMSHELRTPLNAIIGFSELLTSPRVLSPENRIGSIEEYAGIIHQSGTHLLSLVNDLLDLSRIEAGKIDLQIERVDLVSVVSDVEELISSQVRAKNQSLVCLVDPSVGALEADRRTLVQMLLNLLSNAIKYSQHGKPILLSVTGVDDRIAFTVRDEGEGMTEIEIAEAMEPFARLTNAETTRESGTGLGLCIVAALAKAQGGRLTMTSEPGKGTEARICLPHRVALETPAPRERAAASRAAVA